MYKKKRNSKSEQLPKKDLLSTVDRIIEDSNNRMEILDFEENTVYEEIKKESKTSNNLKKTPEITKKINRKLNSSEVLDFDKTTAFEPIKISNVKKSYSSSKKNKPRTSNMKKTSKITKKINKKLNSHEVLDFDKTTVFEPIKISNVKRPYSSNKKTNLRTSNLKKTPKITKKINRKLNSHEVLDFDKTTVFEPIKINNIKPYKKTNQKKKHITIKQKIYKYIKAKNKQIKRKLKFKEVLDYDKTTLFEPINLKKYNNKSFNIRLRRLAIACITLTLLFAGFQQITTNTNIITQQAKKVLASLGIYTEEITSSEIQSSNYGDEASWKIDKSVKWIDTNKVELTINLESIINANNNNKNIILLLDTSKSMTGEKLDSLKETLKSFVSSTIDSQNVQISIVTFSDSYNIKAYLTNDKELLIKEIEDITLSYDTNYSAAIRSINKILDKNHTKGENTVAVLLTDGYPNIEIGSHEGEYNLIKDLFPKLKINAIQYEVGNEIINELKKVSDEQRIATKSNIRRVLLESTVSPEVFENFKVTDSINNEYFTIQNLSDIKTSIGTAMTLEEKEIQKIEWNLSNNYITGEKETLKAILTLKDEYVDNDDIYLISENTEITSKRTNEKQNTKEYKNPLVLKNVYEVTYQANKPDGCSIPNISSDKYFVYTNVSKLSNELNCPGYLFKGWELSEDDEKEIKKINSDVFLMPPHDITLKGTWTKQAITVSMEGKVKEKTTLYKVLENEALEGEHAKAYTGEHQDSIDSSKSTEKIYHYYAANDSKGEEILNKNNVIFANYCWQMIRTTDTGGVKIIYNGEAVDNKCLNTRSPQAGYDSTATVSLSSTYWYGTNYEYDSANKVFKISGTLEQATWNESTNSNLVGKYTCKNTSQNSTCTKLYYIESVNSSTSANTLVLTNDSHYSQLGETKFNETTYTPMEVGYMYNNTYKSNVMLYSDYEYSLTSLNADYWFAANVEWSPAKNKYIAINPYKPTALDYINLPGTYAFNDPDGSGMASSVQYVVGMNDSNYYYITLSEGYGLDYYDYTYTYGDSYTENPDGTYTINNPSTIKRTEWFDKYQDVKNKYICKNAINNTCSEIIFIPYVVKDSKHNISSNNLYKYSNSFTYDGTNYILDDENAVYIWDTSIKDNKDKINNAHYTCQNLEGICSSISYVQYNSGGTNWYINLTNGEGAEQALNNMLNSDNINKNNSTIKNAVEAWYANYLVNYDDYIEDTIYCNERTIIDKAGWNPNGGNISNSLRFKNSITTNILKCSNKTDMFSINNQQAKSKYKIGLMTAPEMNLLNNNTIRNTSNYYFLLTPEKTSISGEINHVTSFGGIYERNASYSSGVRPAISLRPGIEYLEGDGSMEYPYVIDTNN